MIKKIMGGALALMTIGGLMAMGQSHDNNAADTSTDAAIARNLEVFNTISRHMAQFYVDSIRPDVAFEAAINAMLSTIDPYTEYYNSEEVARLEQMTTGAYGGIGAMVMSRDGDTYISLPLDGTPSFRAGLKPGDRILMVDSVNVLGKPTDFTTKRLKGDPGTKVTVTVERPYAADSILTFEIMREKVQDKSVPFYGVVDGVGYVQLTSFMEKSPEEMKAAFTSFKKNPNVKGVVIDLRENGGGLVESAVEILGMILPRGTKVLETRSKNPGQDKVYTTSNSPILPDMPLVILVNDGSASASEITAGAVQDLDRGVLLGTRSFGKGLVQGTMRLPYDGVLKITTAKYHLPSGRLIQALDYSHRNPDGSVAPTPDSLTNEFKTRAGRIVRDGGGLVPDSVIQDPNMSRLGYNLLSTYQIFDYATKFVSEHPSIPAPGEFAITDDIYAEFVAFVDTAKVKSDKYGERILEELRSTATTEGFMTDELQAEIDAMMPLVAPDLQRDLYNRRHEIEEYLGREIVGRYYNRAGEIEYILKFDPVFETAKTILKDKTLYAKFLQP